MAVIISSHKSTVAMMNSIHTLLSENHSMHTIHGQPPSGYRLLTAAKGTSVILVLNQYK